MTKDVEHIKYFVSVIQHHIKKNEYNRSEEYKKGFTDACEVVDNLLNCIISGYYGDFDKNIENIN